VLLLVGYWLRIGHLLQATEGHWRSKSLAASSARLAPVYAHQNRTQYISWHSHPQGLLLNPDWPWCNQVRENIAFGVGRSATEGAIIAAAQAAQAHLMNPRLLILDDATASVDTGTEHLI